MGGERKSKENKSSWAVTRWTWEDTSGFFNSAVGVVVVTGWATDVLDKGDDRSWWARG